jgi:hypothetical protein
VHRFHPRLVPLVNILLYILTVASLLVAAIGPKGVGTGYEAINEVRRDEDELFIN